MYNNHIRFLEFHRIFSTFSRHHSFDYILFRKNAHVRKLPGVFFDCGATATQTRITYPYPHSCASVQKPAVVQPVAGRAAPEVI